MIFDKTQCKLLRSNETKKYDHFNYIVDGIIFEEVTNFKNLFVISKLNL